MSIFFKRRTSRTSSRHSKAKSVAILAVSVMAAAGVIVLLVLLFSGKASFSTLISGRRKSEVLASWNAGDRVSTLQLCRQELEKNPLDPFYLSFNGFSAYYLAMEKQEGEERLSLLDEAVTSLRKSLAVDEKSPVLGQEEYVLGKAYYQKGLPWYDLSLKYLEKAKLDNYSAPDLDQYLGLLYAASGDHGTAIKHFETALKNNPSDVLMISAALSYKESGNTAKAVEILNSAISSSSDDLVVLKCRMMIADIEFDTGNLKKAEELYNALVKADPSLADAWFRLGVIYEAWKDPIRARAAWRKAIAQDPNHVEARKKLSERL